MIILTRDQIAELRGCSPATVSKYNLPHAKDHKENRYNLLDPLVLDWVMEPYVKMKLNDMKREATADPEEMDALKAEKIIADIKLKDEQHKKIKLQNEITAKNLIPVELVAIYIGHFAAGIKDNFLPIGNNVAKGNKTLRDDIEHKIKLAIEKTLLNAARGLRNESKKILEALGEDDG